MSAVFQIKEHLLPCQHIREYPRATANSQEDVLQLAIKQYIPLDNPNPQPGDVTIIGAHANGFPKELYEALWEDLHARGKANGFRIRSIWIADVAQQGASGVLNEDLLGNDPSWMDHPRDLLHMVNQFRAEMPLPLVGVGHSFGGNNLVNLSLMHPRLFSALVLLDPVIQLAPTQPVVDVNANPGSVPAKASTFRRDLWPSRAEAETAFRKQAFYKSWDPRVFDAWLKFGVRETPTNLYPNEKGAATLSTTKHQEVFTFLRPNYVDPGESEYSTRSRASHPDVYHDRVSTESFSYRSETISTMMRLANLRPPTLYIFGGDSYMSQPVFQEEKLRTTGSGWGGSGGIKEGRVKGVSLEGIGHLVAMDAPGLCADSAAAWIGQETKRWAKEMELYKEWTKRSLKEKSTLSEEWQRRMGGDPRKRAKGKL